MPKPATLHSINAVRVEAPLDLIHIEGDSPKETLVHVVVHRRVIAALVGSLIHAHGKFPKEDAAVTAPIQPLTLSGAAAIILENHGQHMALELLLGDGLALRVIVPDGAIKSLRLCLDAMIARQAANDRSNGS